METPKIQFNDKKLEQFVRSGKEVTHGMLCNRLRQEQLRIKKRPYVPECLFTEKGIYDPYNIGSGQDILQEIFTDIHLDHNLVLYKRCADDPDIYSGEYLVIQYTEINDLSLYTIFEFDLDQRNNEDVYMIAWFNIEYQGKPIRITDMITKNRMTITEPEYIELCNLVLRYLRDNLF